MTSRVMSSEINDHVGKNITMYGWVHTRRDHGKLIFIDLRDRDGLTQVVFLPNSNAHKLAHNLRPEFVIKIEGKVNERPKGMINENMASGKVELEALELEILNEAKTPPFEVDKDTKNVDEELRMKYRYLDLRTNRMKNNLILRDKIITFFREHMHKNDFIEIETPILMKGTPEGSREYIVPSRLHSGKFYVLPQSPQQFKQLLMIGGVEKYFQIARCFRDEDQRGDRQPEFTQLDYEMSFVTQEDIIDFTEKMFIELVAKVAPDKRITSDPFTKLTYEEAMKKYKTDKPDLRKNPSDPNELAFCWIVDFPMFERDENGDIQAMHHPFCAIKDGDEHLLDNDPFKIRANSYDLVLNGYELSSGSIRIHSKDFQEKIFDLLKISKEDQKKRFGHMLEAFSYGAPPHGGFAPGIDRIAMLLASEPNIREVIAFPKTGDARDLMMDAPSELPTKQLNEVHIEVKNKR